MPDQSTAVAPGATAGSKSPLPASVSLSKRPSSSSSTYASSSDSTTNSSKALLKARFSQYHGSARHQIRDCATLLRSIGLHALAFVGYSDQETTKVAFKSSVSAALAVCTVHIIPVLAEILIVWVNWFGVLYGDGTPVQLAVMQGVAKIVELLAVGSLTTIVVSVLRAHLCSESGISFGFLGAGITFTQINWFWSPAFLLSIRRSWQQIFVALTLIVCGGIAVAIGPAAAVLLVPVLRDDWYGGGTAFWLNGTTDTLWPTMLTSGNAGPSQCLSAAAFKDGYMGACAYEGYPALRNAFQISCYPAFRVVTERDGMGTRALEGTLRIPRYRDPVRGDVCETFSYGPSLAAAKVTGYLEDLWINAVNRESGLRTMYLKYAFPYTGSSRANLPAVRTRCTIAAANPINRTVELHFPVLPEFEYFNYTYWKINETFDDSLFDSSNNMLRWISLDKAQPPNGNGDQTLPSAALLITLGSHTKLHNLEDTYLLSCSVDARWADGHNTRQVTVQKGKSEPMHQPKYGRPLHTVNRGGCDDPWAPAEESWRRISMDQSYLSWLAPSLDGGPSSNTALMRTTLSDIIENSADANANILYETGGDSVTPPVEMIIAHTFVDALSRVGWQDNFNTLWDMGGVRDRGSKSAQGIRQALLRNGTVFTKPSYTNTFETTWEVRNTGYVLQASSPTAILAIAVLLLHITLALIHTIYVLHSRKTSTAWDSMEELLALIWNSEPSRGAPKNTSVGINSRSSLAAMVKICVVDPTPGVATEEVQLVGKSEPGKSLVRETAYGERGP